jgi:hypothetical protein
VHVAFVAAKLHAALFATQRLPSQQPPDEHAPPAQHGCPEPPHAWHVMPGLEYQQTLPASLQALPAQHG